MYLNATRDVVGSIMCAMMDCYKESRLGKEEENNIPVNWSIYSWPQTWGSTGLGFGGIAGQAFTQAQTVIIRDHDWFVVYHGGKYAYTVKKPNGKFMRAFAEKILPGKVAFDSGEFEEKKK